jgi:hypothetical protein
MKLPILLLALTLIAVPLSLRAQEILAEDYGSDPAYGGGWNSGSKGGRGFGPWTHRTAGNLYEYSHSGFGTRDGHPTLGDKVFTMWANGEYFETSVAFRPFDKALEAGDSFSLVMDNGPFERRFDNDDPAPGRIGFSLRSGNNSETWEQYELDARLVFGFFEGEENYQLLDGSDSPDTGVPFSTTGVYIGVKPSAKPKSPRSSKTANSAALKAPQSPASPSLTSTAKRTTPTSAPSASSVEPDIPSHEKTDSP